MNFEDERLINLFNSLLRIDEMAFNTRIGASFCRSAF